MVDKDWINLLNTLQASQIRTKARLVDKLYEYKYLANHVTGIQHFRYKKDIEKIKLKLKQLI